MVKDDKELAPWLNKVLRFLSIRPRSEWEIRQYLRKKSCPPSLMANLLSYLYQNQLLDDSLFASWWIDQRLSFRPKGRRFLYSELLTKGIDKNIIDEKLSVISDEQLVESAKKMLKKKISLRKRLTNFSQKKAIFDLLGRRGFSMKIINLIIDDLL